MRHIATAAILLAAAGAASAAERWLELPEPPAMPAAARSGMAPVNDIEMYYAVYGEGDPVLLIHGGLGHAEIWANQVADLMTDHMVIVADSRGHGRSTRSEQPFGYDLMASDYLVLLDFLGVDKVDLVGWSDGGIIGIDIALTHPERLDRLFAQAANVTTDGVDPAVETNPTFGNLFGAIGAPYEGAGPGPGHVHPGALLRAEKRRCDRLALRVFEANAAARRFYRREGFVEVARCDGRRNEETLPEIACLWAREDLR